LFLRLAAGGTGRLRRLIFVLVALFFFLVDGRALLGWIDLRVPLRPGQFRSLVDDFRQTSVSVLVATIGTAAIQTATALVGYLIARAPNVLFLTLATFVVALIPAVGGAFGTKIDLYPEYVLLAALAQKVGRPVKWAETRRENYAATTQGRDHVTYVEAGATGVEIVVDPWPSDHHAVVSTFSVVGLPGPSMIVAEPRVVEQGEPVLLRFNAAGTPVGAARGAMDAFMERLPGRAITYTDYTEQSAAPVTHLNVAEASLIIDSADAHMRIAARILDHPTDGTVSFLERVKGRAHVTYLTGLSRQAVDILFFSSGASSIQHSVPIQRFQRDMQALANHAIMHAPTGNEIYGRVLCGLQPHTLII